MHSGPVSVTPRGTPSRRGKSPRFRGDSPIQSGSNTLPTSFSNKPPATFTSSLSIPVEGAIPIDNDSSEETFSPPPADMPPQASTSDTKRAPRKSKTDALAALHSQARSSSIGQDDFSYQDDGFNFPRKGPPIPVSPVLDLSSVKTSSPRSIIPRMKPRPFGLEDCPVFHPTMEEFQDPMVYIRSISDHAKNFGICKIVPPVGWKMPFVTDTEVCCRYISVRLFLVSHLFINGRSEFPFQNTTSTP